MSARTVQIDGEYWFTAKYAATLLSTTQKKVEAMAVREILRFIPEGNSCLVAESDVTFLRRNPGELKIAKEGSRMPAYPRRGEKMPSAIKYVGSEQGTGRTTGAIGHPLKDPKKS